MLQSVKAQINSLKVVMNEEYLKLVNVTLYKEVIAKHISSSVSQFVLVALARAGMIVISKHLLEMIITKREYLRKQRENTEKQKRIELDDKLKEMQKSTDKQLDDKISGKIDQNVHRTVRTILSTDLNPKAFKLTKRSKSRKILLLVLMVMNLLLALITKTRTQMEDKHRLFLLRQILLPYNHILHLFNKLLWTSMDNSFS